MAEPLNSDHRANRLLAALEPADFACLEADLVLVDLALKQVLYEMEDHVSHAYFPHDAIVSLVNVMKDGTTTEVAVFGREGGPRPAERAGQPQGVRTLYRADGG